MKNLLTLLAILLTLEFVNAQKIYLSEENDWEISEKRDSIATVTLSEKNLLIVDEKVNIISSDSIQKKEVTIQEDCPKLKRRSVLCDSIQSRRDDTDPNSDYDYKFERDMDSIVCADPKKESRKEIDKKIHDVFIKYGDDLYCDSLSFNVSKGNFLKMAVLSSFGDFLKVAVKDWRVPLNRIDQGDGRTPLDYVRDEMNKNKGSVTESVLKGYYELLRRNGAKHKSELTPDELKRNGKPDGHKDCKADAPCKF